MSLDIDDQQQQRQDELLAREHRFRQIFDDLPALVTLLKPTGGVQLANRQALEFFGATLEEIKTWELPDVIHPDDLAIVEAAWNKAVATGEAYEVEGRHRRADGVYRWLHMRARTLLDSKGRVLLWYLVQTDVDDRKRAEALLAGEKRLLEMVAMGRPLQLVLTELCNLFDATTEEFSSGVLLIDRTRTRVQYAVAPRMPTAYNTSLEGRLLSSIEGPCGAAVSLNEQVIVSDVTSDPRWDGQGWPGRALANGLMAWWSTPIVSLRGELLGTFAIHSRAPGSPTPFHQELIEQFTHIASIAMERARSEEELNRSKALLAEAQRLSATGSFLWRVANDEMTWSEQVYRMYQLDPAVPPTFDLIASRVHPEDLHMMHDMVDRARGLGTDFEYEHRLQMPDGSVTHVHLLAHAIRDAEGQLEYVGAVRDVTQSRLAEEALNKVRQDLARVARVTSLGALTASIAHEVNQPLAGIVTNASTCLRMLAADPPNIDGARETARRTIRDGNRASDVISRLRALFSKRDTATELVDLNEAIREVVALSLSELQRNRVIVRSELAEDLPQVRGDRVQLQQVVLNLLLNGSEAMSAVYAGPRTLLIRSELESGDRVRVSVQDVGVGFEADAAEKLFDAFYTTKSGGMGIGLSVSRSIIESHHGRLSAAPNDGPGATFSFSIPFGLAAGVGAYNLGDVKTCGVDMRRNP